MISVIKIYIISCLVASNAIVASGVEDYQQALKYAKGKTSSITKSIRKFDAQQQFDHYTEHPSQSMFYGHDRELKQQGMSTFQHSDIGRTEVESDQRNPKGTIDSHSNYIKDSNFIKLHASAIARGQSDKAINCEHPQNNPHGLICGGDFYCMDGHCSPHNSQINSNFGSTTAALAAVGSSAADVSKSQDKKSPNIFRGHAMSCADDVTGFVSCCKDKGWGKDLNLVHCNNEEQRLGQNRQNKLTIYVGKYCSHRTHVLHVCLQHKKVFCSFDSKLAKIVQNQGRQKQLHINFGDVSGHHSYPNCRGLSVIELSTIDFSKIDFRSVYQDIRDHTNIPNNSEVDTDIKNKIHDFYDQGGSHDQIPS